MDDFFVVFFSQCFNYYTFNYLFSHAIYLQKTNVRAHIVQRIKNLIIRTHVHTLQMDSKFHFRLIEQHYKYAIFFEIQYSH